MSRSTAYGFLLAGGAITLIVAAFAFLASAALTALPFFPMMGMMQYAGAFVGAFALWEIIVGLIMIWSATQINRNRDPHGAAVVGLIFSVLGLITFAGFFVGPLLGIVGAAIGLGVRGDREVRVQRVTRIRRRR